MKPRRPKHTKTRKAAVKAGFRSGFEKAIADDLTKRGIPFKYEQTTFTYFKPVRGGLCAACNSPRTTKRGRYLADFDIGQWHLEAKGRLTASERTKIIAVRESNPGIDLRLLFMADNYTTKTKRERYSCWAARHGFLWHVGREVPDAWINSAGVG